MRATTLCIGVLALAACSSDKEVPKPAPVPAAPAKPSSPAESLAALAEQEPNDTPQRAQLIDGPARIAGDLHPVQPASHADEDWYRVQPKAPLQELRAELSGFSGEIAFEVYDRDLNKLRTISAGAGQAGTLPWFRIQDALYLRVFSPKGLTGPYSLALFLQAPDPDAECEPNDRPADATPLPLDHPMHGTIGTSADEDWYRVEVAPPAVDAGPPPPALPDGGDGGTPAGADAGADAGAAPDAGPPPDAGPLPADANPAALLQIKLSGVPGLRLLLHLFDQDQRPLADLESRSPGDPIEARDLALMPGIKAVYLVVQSGPLHGKRPAAPDAPYTLAVHEETAPPNFEIEPNDSVDSATPIVWDAPASGLRPSAGEAGFLRAKRLGYLSPRGDVDFYVVHVAAPSLLHAHLSGLDHVDTELSVVDRPTKAKERDSLIFRVNEGGPKDPEVIPAIALAPGDHFVKVEAAAHQVGSHWLRDQENPTDSYQLDVTLSPDDGSFEREPNNGPAEATPLKLGQSVKGYAYPAKDVDFFRLDLSAQPIGTGAVIRLQGVAKVPLSLELRGPVPPGDTRSEGALINTSDHGKAGVTEEIRAKLDPGIYLIELRPAPSVKIAGQPGGDPDDPYTLTVQGE